MNNFSAKLARFMMGRRGRDEFGMFLFILALALSVLYAFTHAGMLYYIALFLLIYQVVRAMSRNIPKRYQENQRFLKEWNKIRNPKAARQQRRQQASYNTGNKVIYRYFNCPSCGLKMRAPNGKGRIRVTCSRCSKQFETLV